MAGIIKNQILKHLSKFAKNLSPNSINVSALKGEGELTDLELNEKVLTELLELPNWMQITRASVNKVSIKIPWTKLKTTPIQLFLDEVLLEMETVAELRSPASVSTDLGSLKSNSKYGYVEKVIDGLTVNVNSVFVRFKSPSFNTSVHLSKIRLCSKSPTWQFADLRSTRLKDLNQQYVLIFKELYWHSLRIEAKSSDAQMTPIRLITNQSCCRITVKKKLSDCSVIGCRLVLLSEEIVWALTDSQILSAHRLAESLSGLIKKSTNQTQKEKAARKLESLHKSSDGHLNVTDPDLNSSRGRSDKDRFDSRYGPGGLNSSNLDQASLHRYEVFRKFDVVETSYHFSSDKIDLHFCDDLGPGRSSYPDLSNGGMLQVSLIKIRFDFYPYHPALADRNHWVKYQPGSINYWTKTSLNHFKSTLCDFFSDQKSSHAPLGRSSPHLQGSASPLSTGDGGSRVRAFVNEQLTRLMSVCLLLSCKDVIVYKVASTKRKSKISQMIAGDDDRFAVPSDSALVQVEFSSYYFPRGMHYPVPASKIFAEIKPIKVEVDLLSCLWLNAFVCHLVQRTLKMTDFPPYFDFYLEALMPRVIMKPFIKWEKEPDRPRALQVCLARMVASNVRSPDPVQPGSKAALFTCLEEAQKGPLFFLSEFPSRPGDRQPIPNKFLLHAEGSDMIARPADSDTKEDGYPMDLLWQEPRDILFLFADGVYLDYLEKTSDQPQKSSPFVHPCQFSIWVHVKDLSWPNVRGMKKQMEVNGGCEGRTNVLKCQTRNLSDDPKDEVNWQVLVFCPGSVSAQISRLQFLFLMRVLDAVNEFTTFLNEDTLRIQKKLESMVIAVVISEIQAALVFPPTASLFSDTVPTSPSAVNGASQIQYSEFDSGLGAPEDPNSTLSYLDTVKQEENSFLDDVENLLAKSQSDSCIKASGLEIPHNHLDDSISKSGNDLLSPYSSHSPRTSSKRGSGTLSRKSSTSSITSSVKKGFQSLKITIENSVGGPRPVNDDASETCSIHSDISNDSDNFVLLNLSNSTENLSTTFFKSEANRGLDEYEGIEAATEALEDVTPSFSEPSEASASTSAKEEKQVGALAARLKNCQVIIEGQGHNSIVKLCSTLLGVDEFANVRFDELRLKGKEGYKKSSEGSPDSETSVAVRLQSEGVIHVNQPGVNEEELPYYLKRRYSCRLPVLRSTSLEAKVTDVDLKLSMSSLLRIGELVQEEIDPIPLPMKVYLENIFMELIDDKSSLVKNFQRFHVPKMMLERNEAMDFTVVPLPVQGSFERAPSTPSSASIAPAKIPPDEDTEALRSELAKVREQLASAQRENANLMKALTLLHEDSKPRK